MTGDLDDPQSRVSRIAATKKVATRKAYKGTQPKLFYVGIEGDLLQPSMMRPEHGSMWADYNPLDGRRPATGDGAADLISRGELSFRFWIGVVLIGTIVPLILLGTTLRTGGAAPAASAAMLALVGLWTFENLWIEAGQAVPLS